MASRAAKPPPIPGPLDLHEHFRKLLAKEYKRQAPKRLLALSSGELRLANVQKVTTLDVTVARFPPVPYAGTKILSWWTRLVSIPVVGAREGDFVEVLGQVEIAGYQFDKSAWVPVGCTVTHGEAWKFDSPAQKAGNSYTGSICLPFGGENTNNRDGGYYRPHQFCVWSNWEPVDRAPFVVNPVVALSCNEVRNDRFLQIFHEGGASMILVKLWRPVAA